MREELLLLPDKYDEERESLAEVWQTKGGLVKRIGKFWIKPATENKKVSLYGSDSFCLVLAQILGLELLSPRDELIAELPEEYVKRGIEIIKVEKIDLIKYPKFIKPVIPKLFKAEIFENSKELAKQLEGLGKGRGLICSEIVEVEKEIRSFIFEQEIKDLAYYEGRGELGEAIEFIENFLKNNKLELPQTYVLDIGYNSKLGWFIIEFNSSWGSGLNSCQPEKVLDCIRIATQKEK